MNASITTLVQLKALVCAYLLQFLLELTKVTEKITAAATKHAASQAELEEKTCFRCQARENMQPVESAGKYAAGDKRGKTCYRCQAQGNLLKVPNAGKHATGGKRGKMHV